jgi:hypothetical protein
VSNFDPRFDVGGMNYSVTHLEKYLVLKDRKSVELSKIGMRNESLDCFELKAVHSLRSGKVLYYENLSDVIELIRLLNGNI